MAVTTQSLNLDTNSWYQIIAESSQFLAGNKPVGATAGGVSTSTNDATDPRTKWQVLPINSTYYLLRTPYAGSLAVLSTCFSASESTNGKTQPCMRNFTLEDNSMYWAIPSFTDGNFAMVNKDNGSSWHLWVKDEKAGRLAMTNNISSPATGQRFKFNKVAKINNADYSGVPQIPTETSTTPPPANPTPASPGLTAGAKAAIGASVGGVALIALLALGFLLLRRRRKRSSTLKSLDPVESSPKMAQLHAYDKVSQSSSPAELSGRAPVQELDGRQEFTAELPAYPNR